MSKIENTIEESLKRQHIRGIINFIGDDIHREGLKDTPSRVVKMWKEIFRGYDIKNKPELAVFDNGKDGLNYDQMIIDSGKFYSHCEHHMVPFFGEYWFAYIPHEHGKILGLSKVARLVDFHSAKLQIQERLGHDIVQDLWQGLSQNCKHEPLGMALVMKAQHLCKTMRGARKEGTMTTSTLKGVFQQPEVRQEFLNFILK